MSKGKKVLFGATLGTLLGSIAVAMYPKRSEIVKVLQDQKGSFTEKAKQVSDYIKEGIDKIHPTPEEDHNNEFWTGSLLGLIAGASAALLLTPKTGKEVRKQLTKAYNDVSDKTGDLVDTLKKNAKKLQAKRTRVAKEMKKDFASATKTVKKKINTASKKLSSRK